MANREIIEKAKKQKVELEDISKILGIDIYSFKRILLKELAHEDKEEIFSIIQGLSEIN